VTENRAEELSKSADAGSGAPEPPAANQAKDEPIATTPSESPQSSSTESSASGAASAGGSSRARGEQGEDARPAEVDDVRAAATMRDTATLPAHAAGGVPSPGDAKGVSVPAVQAARGTSEETGAIEAVNTTALAPPGKPDGEVDTRP
jgi:hypothetical protein